MSISYVIKGGSVVNGDGTVDDNATVMLHSTICESATAKGDSVIGRSTIAGNAVVDGSSVVMDAHVAGSTELNGEYIGKNGFVTDNTHYLYMRIAGIGYTIHRTHSDAKGFGAQIMCEDGKKVTEVKLKQLVTSDPAFRALQFAFNAQKKLYQLENPE